MRNALIRKNINIILLALILLIAGIVRFYALGTIPDSLNWDEAALGYNAYSLGVDGRDEFGNLLPIKYLESYGDFKPVVYSYLAVIPVKFLGLNEFGVRFPSAFLGVLTVLIAYLLVKEIFYKNKSGNKKIEYAALLSALFLAISPWHIMLSRAAYEANVSTFFIVLGIFLFLRAVNKNSWLLVFSAISFAITFYTFNTARIFVPILVIVMTLFFRNEIFKNLKQTIIAALIGLIIILPLIPFLFSPQAKLRYQEVNIFSDLGIIETSNQMIENDNDALWSKILHNRRVFYSQEFIKHYFDNLNPSFLFIKGDGNPRFSTQDVGQLYLLDLPLIIIGLYFLFKNKEGYYWLIPIWILLGIIPAAIARETPHALRIETVIPAFQILAAYGFVCFMGIFKKYKKIIAAVLLILLFVNFLYFYHGLVKHYQREYSSEWQYPYIEMVQYVKSVKDKYKFIEISEELGRPYIYFLIYGNYDPKDFRKSAKIEREVFGFVHVNSFDKYLFKKYLDKHNLTSDVLYIDAPQNVPDGVRVLKKFALSNGTIALVAYIKNE